MDKYFQKVRGWRIYLSPICPDDMLAYTKWINDPAVSDNLGVSWNLYSVEKEREFLEETSKTGYNFAIVQYDGDTLIGGASLFEINHVHRCASCGLFIGDEENRGAGYGREALTLLVGYGFNALNLNNIMLKVYSFNKRAIACYEKIGFKEIGRRRSSYFANGGYHDEIFMDILPGELNE